MNKIKNLKQCFKIMYFILSTIVLKFVLLGIFYPKTELVIEKIGIILGVIVITIGAVILAYDEIKKMDEQ